MQLVVLGSGDRATEGYLARARTTAAIASARCIGFDEPLAHRIEAGADLFLMPSRFEPCGLNQMYSMRYGTLPVVRATGGLCDSIVDCTPACARRRGCDRLPLPRAHRCRPRPTAVQRAIAAYRATRHVAGAAAERDGAGLRLGRERRTLRCALPVAGRLAVRSGARRRRVLGGDLPQRLSAPE